MKGKFIYYQSHQCDTKQMFGVFLYSTLNQRWRTGSFITLLDTYLSYVSLQTVLYCWVCQIFHEISEGACLIYVICVCLGIVVSKPYCVLLLLFCFLYSSCVPYAASFSGLFFFRCHFGILYRSLTYILSAIKTVLHRCCYTGYLRVLWSSYGFWKRFKDL
jgi:hypothetical protein